MRRSSSATGRRLLSGGSRAFRSENTARRDLSERRSRGLLVQDVKIVGTVRRERHLQHLGRLRPYEADTLARYLHVSFASRSALHDDPPALSEVWRARPESRPLPGLPAARQPAPQPEAQDSGRGTVAWNRLRPAAIGRDGYACRRCGKAGTIGTLTVHLAPELAGNHLAAGLDDLTTLGRSCHGSVDAPRSHHA